MKSGRRRPGARDTSRSRSSRATSSARSPPSCSAAAIRARADAMDPMKASLPIDGPPAPAERAGTGSVLVVDDDQRNVRLMESILRSSGYQVLKAYNGEEALRIVEDDSPDLLLLDVMMPKMSGFELCQRLKGRYETRLLPIIMVTALNALEDKVQALEYGADDFLSKPINKVELLAKVRSVLRVKALHDELEKNRLEIEKKNQELIRMEGFKESMMQMVVHDLKNPLASIMGNVELIQMQSAETVKRARQHSRGEPGPSGPAVAAGGSGIDQPRHRQPSEQRVQAHAGRRSGDHRRTAGGGRGGSHGQRHGRGHPRRPATAHLREVRGGRIGHLQAHAL